MTKKVPKRSDEILREIQDKDFFPHYPKREYFQFRLSFAEDPSGPPEGLIGWDMTLTPAELARLCTQLRAMFDKWDERITEFRVMPEGVV